MDSLPVPEKNPNNALVKQFALTIASLSYEKYEKKTKEKIWLEREYANKYLGELVARRIVKGKLSREGIISNIYESLLREVNPDTATPWDLAAANQDMYGFKEEGTIHIVVGDDEGDLYEHKVTEEFMFGLTLVLNGTERFMLALKDPYWYWSEHNVNITPGDFIHKYINNLEIPKTYTATTRYGKIYFDTIDVIQGIITGASWLKEDPHKYITNIRENGKLVNF